MDVSDHLAQIAQTSSRTEDDSELLIDAGLLTVYDPSPIDEEEYKLDTEAYLTSHALPPLQALLNTLFSLPTTRTSSGPLASLPPATTLLPREKPLPKPKPLTKWERFANAKGISHSKKDRAVWDEDRQEFVNRWGKDGLNKKVEEQWITEVKVRPDGTEVDPAVTAKADRKARVAKNLKQQEGNLKAAAKRAGPAPSLPSSKAGNKRGADSVPVPISISEGAGPPEGRTRPARKAELERRALLSKVSTGSMGKFDKKLEGDVKVKGEKRKFDANENVRGEQSKAMGLLSSTLGGPTSSKKVRAEDASEGVVNVRKAVRFESKREAASGGGRGRGGGRGGRGGARGRGRK